MNNQVHMFLYWSIFTAFYQIKQYGTFRQVVISFRILSRCIYTFIYIYISNRIYNFLCLLYVFENVSRFFILRVILFEVRQHFFLSLCYHFSQKTNCVYLFFSHGTFQFRKFFSSFPILLTHYYIVTVLQRQFVKFS